MIIDSTAIVLKRFRYGETSIIARCFVEEIGKISFMVHGAHRIKSSKAAYFQPANCIDITFYFKENRDLQTISKASFFKSWCKIPNDLKKISYALAMIELTDKCISNNDPNKNLFNYLLKSLNTIENEKNELNLIYWHYQYQLLNQLGFKPDFDQHELDYLPLPNPFKTSNTKKIFNYFANGGTGRKNNIRLETEDRKIISDYLNTCLGIHFDNLNNIKSLDMLKSLY